jgi:DNA (cytosine-5)-methyltransferase 1
MVLKHGSLFSGIGGFDLASEWMGWENVFHCEWMEFPRKVLDYYWPNADSHIDICKTDFTIYANRIDILTGGFPCQPFSMAGKRKGTNDERYLWGEMLRAIQEIKPQYVIAENVFGITNIDGGLVFEQVCLNLEAEGYEVQPFIIPACAKNAPHRRDRCWFIAKNTMFSGRLHREYEQEGTEIWEQRNTCTRSSERIHLSKRNATDTNSNGFNQCNGNDEVNASQGMFNAFNDINTITMHSNCTMWDRQHIGQKKKRQFNRSNCGNGINNFQNFPTQSPICSRDDGIPKQLDRITFPKWRAESIKGYGNAIVPQVAFELFKQLEL